MEITDTSKAPRVPRFVRPKDVAEALSVDRKTIYRRIADGTIRAIRVGGMYRISAAEFQRIQKEGVEPQ